MSVASENPGHAVVNAQIYRRTSGLVLVGYTEVIPKPPSRKYLKQTVAAWTINAAPVQVESAKVPLS